MHLSILILNMSCKCLVALEPDGTQLTNYNYIFKQFIMEWTVRIGVHHHTALLTIFCMYKSYKESLLCWNGNNVESVSIECDSCGRVWDGPGPASQNQITATVSMTSRTSATLQIWTKYHASFSP